MPISIYEQIDFLLLEKGEDIKVNGVSEQALIIDAVDKINFYDDKIIKCKNEKKSGDEIEYRNSRYLIISQIDKDINYYTFRMRPCNAKIAFNFNGNIRYFDCIVESQSFDITTGTYISTASGNIYITMQNNEDTRDIVIGQRFLTTNQAFRIEGIDKTQQGLIKFNCALDSINKSYDDEENNIVDRWKYEIPHNYALTINNGDISSLQKNDIMQLNINATDNGTLIINPSITFSSSDSSVVTVDNLGKITAILAGQAIITAYFTDNSAIQDSIIVNVVDVITPLYSITITQSDDLYASTSVSVTCTAHIFNNGIEVNDQSVTWNIKNVDNTTNAYVKIASSTGTTCVLKPATSGNLGKIVRLTATLNSDNSVIGNLDIKLMSLW